MKLLTPLLLILVSFGIFYLYIDPMYFSIMSMQTANAQYATTLTNTENAKTRLDTLLNQYNSFSTDNTNRIETALPDKVDPIRLVIDVNALAEKYGTSIRDISVSASGASTQAAQAQADSLPYAVTPLTFTVSLTYQNLLSFLNDIERSLRIMDVTSIHFDPGDSNIYDYVVTVNAYSLK